MKIGNESILFFFFSRVSLSKFSLKTLHFVGIRGIYTRVRVECEESIFQNRAGWQLSLAT